MNVHSGAVCWICLDGGVDDMGKPIVRDCACRGSDAGFAHASCIIKYAKQKSEHAVDLNSFTEPWQNCPNCHQGYQGNLAIQLAGAFVSCAESTYGYPGNHLEDKIRIMTTLRIHLQSIRSDILLKGEKSDSAEHEVKMLVHKMLDIVDRAKKDDMKGWRNMDPTTFEFHKYRVICDVYEAFGYISLGQLHVLDASEESMNIEISNYQKALEIYQSFGMENDAKDVTDLIVRARARFEGDTAGSLIDTRNYYYRTIQREGENSLISIMVGVSYAVQLGQAKCSIEAERLVTKLAAISRQVYGEEHQCYKRSFKVLNQCKRRFIRVIRAIHIDSGGNFDEAYILYRALRYENDGESCVITGPISFKGDGYEDEGQTFCIPSSQFFPASGCPVICHGLINASHLNGKLGEVRSLPGAKNKDDSGPIRLGVYFEDRKLKPAAVKAENLRIAFDLPSV